MFFRQFVKVILACTLVIMTGCASLNHSIFGVEPDAQNCIVYSGDAFDNRTINSLIIGRVVVERNMLIHYPEITAWKGFKSQLSKSFIESDGDRCGIVTRGEASFVFNEMSSCGPNASLIPTEFRSPVYNTAVILGALYFNDGPVVARSMADCPRISFRKIEELM